MTESGAWSASTATRMPRPVQEPPREHVPRRVQVDHHVQRHAEPGREFRRGAGLRQGSREAVQGVPGTADIGVFTTTTTFAIMQSLRLDKGPSGPVHP